MKKRLSRILAFMMVLCMIVTMVPAVFAEGETEAASDKVDILFLGTSDIHGQMYGTNYSNGVSESGKNATGMTRVATYINQQREQYKNVFLADAGDTIQGTPLTYYYAFYQKDKQDPAMKVLRMLDYDMWVVGNHEFNYGMDILQSQLNYITSASTETESQVDVSMANYLDASTNSAESKDWKTWNNYAPYIIKEYDGVKVAVMGIGNPNIANWDVPENWKGIYFAGVIETYNHYKEEMHEKADLVAIVTHSGVNGDPVRSDFIQELVSTTDGIDLVFTGHEHRQAAIKIANKDGKEIPVISPGSSAGAVGRVLVTYNKTDKTYTTEASVVPMSERQGYTTVAKYDVDPTLQAALKPYEDATWNDYMLKPIGSASGNFSAKNLGTAPSAFVDLVNKVQTWGAYDRTGLNTPDDKSDDKPAQLSITAPLTSGSAENLIPEGQITLGDMFRLYRYENWFYQITMSGKEVRTWLECSASKVKVNSDGSYGISGGLTYYDVISGDGFSYVIDASKPSGNRITSMTYNGKEVKDSDSFTVVINNYRYNGGGNYIAYLNEHGCNFKPNDESRVIYSTQYDMIQGEDKGQARNLLADYITEQGTIAPEITSTWKIVNTTPDAFYFSVLSTTDMHGRSTVKDVSSQQAVTNSMERVATAVAAERKIYGENNTIVIDNGDTIQGTLVAQYAITHKADKENPMITAMKAIGYDVWGMGNHEFNYTPQQRDTQTLLADEAGIAVLSANLTLLKDGKNFRGVDTKAGESYYDPYVIKTLDAGNGRTVRVAIIGFGNAANATWDLATNYPNLQFSSLDNPNGDLENEINKWTKEIKDKDLADIIVVTAHSGRGSSTVRDLESQAYIAATKSHDVDLFICGHDHRASVETVKNADGKEIYLIDGGGTHLTKNVFAVTFDENGKVKDFTVTGNNIALKDVKDDQTLAEKLQPWYDETFAWASAPLGKFDNGWDAYKSETEGKNNNDILYSQTQVSNLVHKAQIWATWQNYEKDGIKGATVSIASPVFGTSGPNWTLSLVPTDGQTISTLELAKLYRYANNLLCAVDMTPQQLYAWMSAVADMYTIKDGKPAIGPGSSIFGMDSFYGVDYTFDLTKPAGERVVSAKINGVDLLDMKGTIRVALNSYRMSGGYGFAETTGLSEADCCWTASMNLGADRAPVPTLIGEYVAHMGVVSPTDRVVRGHDSTWNLITYANPFKDVSVDDYYYENLLALAKRGVVAGTSANTFSPNETGTRAQIVAMLWRDAGCPEPTTSTMPFTDVTAGVYYEKAVLWAYENKIVAGTSATTFSPDAVATRAEAVTFIWRYKNAPQAAGQNPFTDIAEGAFYCDAVLWAVDNGVAYGVTSTTFDPEASCTRAQLVAFIGRAVK